jgi:hypothetical protein
MKIALTLFAAATLLAGTRDVRAAETRADVETDHIDAADDGGPRTVGVLVNPLAIGLGRLGVEAEVALGESAAVSVGGAWIVPGIATGYVVSLGVPLFPQRFAFHGVYVDPHFDWSRVNTDGVSVHVLGAGATVGYEWTWPVGATIRLGGGATYSRALATGGARSVAFEGLRPQIDAIVGWVF